MQQKEALLAEHTGSTRSNKLRILPSTKNSKCISDHSIPSVLAQYRHDASSEHKRNTSVATIHFPFESPYIRGHLHQFYDTETVTKINQHLAKLILHQYSRLQEANKEYQKDMDDDDPGSMNDAFYDWQKVPNRRRRAAQGEDCAPGWNYLAEDSEFQKVVAVVQHLADDYLHYLHLSHVAESRSHSVQEAWASVHHDGAWHASHVHGTAMLSAVYYVQVPERSGPIRLEACSRCTKTWQY